MKVEARYHNHATDKVTDPNEGVSPTDSTVSRLTSGSERASSRYMVAQRTQQTRADSSTYDFTYDPIGQLKVANGSVNSEDRGYTYDTAWNLNYRTNNGILSTFTVDTERCQAVVLATFLGLLQ
jgi:hypothetical protein